MSGAEIKNIQKFKICNQENKENLNDQLDNIRFHCTVVKLLVQKLLSFKLTLNIPHPLPWQYNFKYKIFKNSLTSEISTYHVPS